MSVLTNAGRSIIAKSLTEQPIHLAWGTGEDSWGETPPAPENTATTLRNEVGRRAVTEWGFVIPDVNGEVQTVNGNFRKDGKPQPYLWLNFKFDYNDSSTAKIREIGVYVDSEMNAGLPLGQKFFLPEHVKTKGYLLSIEHLYIPRTPTSRETLDIVIAF